MSKLYFATGNKGKVEEAHHILEREIEILDIDLDEIQSLDLEKIVAHKVLQAYEKVKSPVFVDDVSLEFDVWRKFPGPFIKYLQTLGNDLILYMMKNEENRKIKVTSTIGYHDGKKIHYFTGTVEGIMAKEERGHNGWGFDPLFIPLGESQTLGEMSKEKKNSVSHRRRSFEKLKEFLDSQNKKENI